ncbi:MAG: terminase gpA endonuclease subunit, partial [Candidatus Riflebacteria bacterium]
MNETRLQPAIESATCFENIGIKFKQSEIRMSNGGSILMAWASSIAGTASDSVRDQIIDEITKPEYNLATREGESIDRIIQRAITFPNGKALVMSTVTIEGDKMYHRRQKAEAVHYIHIPCPACGAYQQLFFFPGRRYIDSGGKDQPGGCVVWDNNATTNEEKARSARYKCGHCDYLMTNSEKNKALARWICVPDRKQDPLSPRRFISTWRILSPRSPGDLSEIVRAFLDCKDDPQKFQSFVNNCLGEYWTDRVSKPDDNLFSSCQMNYETGNIPDEAIALTIGIDVQKRGFYYVVRGWTREETSFKIEHGYIRSEAELNELVFERTWRRIDGRYMGIWRAGIDTGGGKKANEEGEDDNEISSAEWVYRWYLKNRIRGVQIILTKGSSKELPTLIRIGAPIMRTSDGRSIKNGLQIVSIDTNKTKDLFFWRIAETKKEEPVCASYTSIDKQDDYFDHLKAEEKRRDRKTGKTRWVQIASNNHYLDCEQMQIALVS